MEETDPADEVAAGVEKMRVNDTVDTEANPKPRVKTRRRIVRRKKVDSVTSTLTEHDGTNVQDNASSPSAAVLQTRQEADQAAIDMPEPPSAQLEKEKGKLIEAIEEWKETVSECTLQQEQIIRAFIDFVAEKGQAEDLADRQGHRQTTTDIRFRKYTIPSEPDSAKFDLTQNPTTVQTFTTLPTYGTDKAVLAYMEIAGRPYLAQSGKHPETTDGLIDGTIYTRKACELFQLLGDTEEVTFFQHAEPQLMALYVEKFRNASLSFTQFRDLHGADSLKVFKVYTEVEIFVSQVPCGNCRRLMYSANNTAKRYGFLFSLKDISINQAKPKVKSTPIKQQFVDSE